MTQHTMVNIGSVLFRLMIIIIASWKCTTLEAQSRLQKVYFSLSHEMRVIYRRQLVAPDFGKAEGGGQGQDLNRDPERTSP